LSTSSEIELVRKDLKFLKIDNFLSELISS